LSDSKPPMKYFYYFSILFLEKSLSKPLDGTQFPKNILLLSKYFLKNITPDIKDLLKRNKKIKKKDRN
jgi:hypothetical protein